MAIIEINDLPLQRRVDTKYYLREYDEVLMGKRKTYSAACMNKSQGPNICAEMLRYIFPYYLKWTPEQVRDCLTHAVIKAMKLEPLINRIPSPPEINRDKELYFVAWYLYPKTCNVSKSELIIKVYMDVIEGRISKFPKSYFDGNDGYVRARLLLLIMIREFLSFESVEQMYAFFSSDEGRRAINKYKLTVPLRELYSSPLDYLHDSLAEGQKDDRLYRKYNQNVKRKEGTAYIDVSSETVRVKDEDVDEYETALLEALSSVKLLTALGLNKKGED